MRTLLTILLIVSFSSLCGQKIANSQASPDSIAKNDDYDDEENARALRFFEQNYAEQKFEKYDGNIVTNGDTVKYANKYFLVWTEDKFRPIFSSGIFYPGIVTGPNNKRDYRLAIYAFEEVKIVSPSPTKKRFVFWLTRNTIVNPSVCFIELTNKDATDKTDFETFLNGSSLTFYKEGWIII